MLTKFLDPKNDVAFRKIFGTEKNKDILIHFINDMITFKEGRQIVDATFLKTIQDPETAVKKTSIEDILCKDEIGNCYIVEMQVGKENLELDRFSWNDEELLTYDQAEKYEGAYLASIAQQFDEGKARAIEEGKAEREKLKTALLKAAKNLCDQGLNIEQISEMTDLSIEEINSL